MSALAASCTVPAVMEGPASSTSAANDSGPRLLEIVAEMPLLPSARATLEPKPPEPMMPMLISSLLLLRC
jgi:hypothetical protein